ncbi:alpha/beta fold hydrolase [Nonomuraea longispora]|uniref:Alpha/beta fold hydrolase n=1 Tax=Nonomuraea longispora TaxID=1848320 RepID=A0A4R4N5J6_9ACTN|nr:alpha/beta fold hydrolase [Nonomuraea longispora]TDC01542.1 alpha/beta fold hydrolase [Nonomuraea longispora]
MSAPYGQAPDGFEHTAVTANGITLHAVIGGSGAPVLLLHGWPQTWRAWWHVMPILAQHGYRVIAPDLRAGFGHYRTLLEDARANRAWAEGGGGLPMPVLTVGGEHNAGARLAEALRPIAPHLTSAVIEDSGHFVPDERPDDLARRLTAFLT